MQAKTRQFADAYTLPQTTGRAPAGCGVEMRAGKKADRTSQEGRQTHAAASLGVELNDPVTPMLHQTTKRLPVSYNRMSWLTQHPRLSFSLCRSLPRSGTYVYRL